LYGGVLGGAALALAAVDLFKPTGDALHDMLFALFSGAAVVAAVCMVTNRNPVYAALWFAVATLGVCGLFLLRSAAFLAAATVVVYAGAIVVMFLFVIMLARQVGVAVHDQQSHQPLWGTLSAFALLGGMLLAVGRWSDLRESAARTAVAATERQARDADALAATAPVDSTSTRVDSSRVDSNWHGQPRDVTMRGLGRALFGEYLFAVEMAGTLLLVAAVGAIAIAPRTTRETP
jgi:NADH-quinone oxidoreductase subunit J